jgi:RNA polymerase sigma-70 factor (ECF subfamily)
VALYDLLVARWPSPVVALNRAIAVAEVSGPAAALSLVDGLAGDLEGYHLFHAVRGDLLERLDRGDEAAASYAAALERTDNGAERALLGQSLARVETTRR